jgi:hypothetical protein
VARDRDGATFDAVSPNVDSASIAAALEGVVTPANRFVRDGGKAILAFARKANIPLRVAPAPGKPSHHAPETSRLGRPRQPDTWMRGAFGMGPYDS